MSIGDLGVDAIVSAEAASGWAGAHPRLARLSAVAHRPAITAVFIRDLSIYASAITESVPRVAFTLPKNAAFAHWTSRITLAAIRCTLAHVHTGASAKELAAWALAGSPVTDSPGAASVGTRTTIGTIARQRQAHAPAVTLTARAGLSTLPVSAGQGSSTGLPAAATIGCIILRVRAAPCTREFTRCTARTTRRAITRRAITRQAITHRAGEIVRCRYRRLAPILNFRSTRRASQPQ